MAINKSYRIWTAPRTGHTLLARLLNDTGVVGTPGEHLTLHNENSLAEKYGVSTYDEMVQAIQFACSGGSSVGGCKIDSHKDRHNALKEELLHLKGIDTQNEESDLWSDIFPNSKEIFLTRRNKVRQAISWWKAIQDNEWHITAGGKRKTDPSFYEGKYDSNAILHLWKESMLREANMQDYFTKYGLKPLTLVYEDYTKDLEGTLKLLMDFLEIEDAYTFPEMQYQKTADGISEKWVDRFKSELQKGWTDQVY